jgi:hypothetical protein
VRLTGVKPGDLIRVNDGMPYIAEVVDAPVRQRVRVRPVTFKSTAREVKARDVVTHWRKARVSSA